MQRRNGDIPTPPESVEGALANNRKRRKRKDSDRPRRVKHKAAKVLANAPVRCPLQREFEIVIWVRPAKSA
jgi:hypothetical protein